MSSAYERLIRADERITNVALELDQATEALARIANRQATHLIPAPTAYRILGEIKSSTINLHEVLEALPDGLRNTLTIPGIRVYDHNVHTGEDRDPESQVELASHHLNQAAALLQELTHHLEAAQTALNAQGFHESNDPGPRQAPSLTPPQTHLRTRITRGRPISTPPPG